MSKRILVVDDDPVIPEVIGEILEGMGHTVETASSGEEGVRVAHERRFDLLVVDLVLPGIDGAEVTRRYLDAVPGGRVVVVSGHPNAPQAKIALERGALAVIPKPFEIAAILDHLE